MFATLISIMLFAQAGPSPSPEPQLPEIGRVRSNTPACTAMREVVLPATKASRDADERFVGIANRLPDYARILTDADLAASPRRNMEVARMDSAASVMLEDATKISKALDDPRLPERSTDPQIQNERAALEGLYDTQMSRAAMLMEFTARERIKIARGEIAGLTAETAIKPTPTPSPTPGPYMSNAPAGQPRLTGIDVRDEEVMRNWSRGMLVNVRQSELRAVQLLIPIANGCE